MAILTKHVAPGGEEFDLSRRSVMFSAPESDEAFECSLGNNKPAALQYEWVEYGTTPSAPLIPRSQWMELMGDTPPDDFDPFVPYVHYQNGVGQCNADAAVAAFEYTRLKQGLPPIELSAADMYARINGGQDNGSILEDAMRELLARGVGTSATAGLIWKRGQQLASDAERARFKALEVFLCPTFDHVFSAALRAFGGVSGVMWGNYGVGSDGWLTLGGGPYGGHAVFSYKPTYRRKADGSIEYGIWHQNSWAARWGKSGRCVFPESLYHRGNIGGWWALRSVTDEGALPMV